MYLIVHCTSQKIKLYYNKRRQNHTYQANVQPDHLVLVHLDPVSANKLVIVLSMVAERTDWNACDAATSTECDSVGNNLNPLLARVLRSW